MTSRVFHIYTPHLNILPLCCMCACVRACVCVCLPFWLMLDRSVMILLALFPLLEGAGVVRDMAKIQNRQNMFETLITGLPFHHFFIHREKSTWHSLKEILMVNISP